MFMFKYSFHSSDLIGWWDEFKIIIVVLSPSRGNIFAFFQVWPSQVAHVWTIVALCQTVTTNHVTHALRTIAAPVAPFTQTESALWVVLTGTITKRDVYGAATHALVKIDGNMCTSPPLVCLYVHVLFSYYMIDTPRFLFQFNDTNSTQ